MKSKYKGVCWHKASGMWQTMIRIDGYRKHLGYFKNEEDAAEAYKKKAKNLGRI